MPRNEPPTRFELIDPALFERGWHRSAIRLEEDRRLLADNLRHFGAPAYKCAYEQSVADGCLAPADGGTSDLLHARQEQPGRVRGVPRRDLEGKQLANALTGQTVERDAVAERNNGSRLELRLIVPARVKAAALDPLPAALVRDAFAGKLA